MFTSNITLRLLFEDKVWAHKVNSLEELRLAQEKFKGIELDLVFKESDKSYYFDVNHPPDSSLNLSLNTYLQSMQHASSTKYWLDFKNLNQDNEKLSSSLLNSLANTFEIAPENIIVESTNPLFLGTFKKYGFKTAYYLPMNMNSLDSASLQTTIEEIHKNITLYDNTHISSDYKDYELVNTYFPNKKKIVWFTLYNPMNKIEAKILIFKILRDPNVDVLLVPFSVKD